MLTLERAKPPVLAPVAQGAAGAGSREHETAENGEGRGHAQEEHARAAEVGTEKARAPARAEDCRQDRQGPGREQKQSQDHHAGTLAKLAKLLRGRLGEKRVQEGDGSGLVQGVVLVAALG